MIDIHKIERNPSIQRWLYSPAEDSSFVSLVESRWLYEKIRQAILQKNSHI